MHEVAVLGWAHGHVGLYVEEMVSIPEISVVQSWDPDPVRGESQSHRFGCGFTRNLDGILSDPRIQCVLVGTETSLHADVCVAAAEAGKRIALQKPMALTLGDCDRILDAVDRYAVPFTLLWQMRVDPQNQKIREIVRSGILGKITLVRRKHCLSTHLWPGFENSWHVKPDLNRGMWMDDAAHAFDFIYWVFGMPTSVASEIATLVNPRIPDDTGVALFRLQDGAIAEVVSSFTANAGENTTEIHGDRGTLIQNYGDAVSASTPRSLDSPGVKWILNGEKEWTYSDLPSPVRQADRLRALARPMVDFFMGKAPAIATAEEGRAVTEMLLASYESAETGQRVTFPFGKNTGPTS